MCYPSSARKALRIICRSWYARRNKFVERWKSRVENMMIFVTSLKYVLCSMCDSIHSKLPLPQDDLDLGLTFTP